MGKSYAFSTTKDERLAIGGDAGQVTAPGSQIANPLGLAIGSTDYSHTTANISYGDVEYNEFGEQAQQLVEAILKDNQKTIDTLGSLGTRTLDQIGSTSDTLLATVEGIKAPLSQYLPYVVLGIVVLFILKISKK